ncbi:hypothetical protein B7486_45920 [cyanobacterium TDX16]|nr:hypothetical protein B7486_45920 [cyanobacterium TDX16]
MPEGPENADSASLSLTGAARKAGVFDEAWRRGRRREKRADADGDDSWFSRASWGENDAQEELDVETVDRQVFVDVRGTKFVSVDEELRLEGDEDEERNVVLVRHVVAADVAGPSVRARVTDVADAVTVAIGLIGIGIHRAVVAGVAGTVHVGVFLEGIRVVGAIVVDAADAVGVGVVGWVVRAGVAGVADAVGVAVGLIGVGVIGTVVAGVAETVGVGVGADIGTGDELDRRDGGDVADDVAEVAVDDVGVVNGARGIEKADLGAGGRGEGFESEDGGEATVTADGGDEAHAAGLPKGCAVVAVVPTVGIAGKDAFEQPGIVGGRTIASEQFKDGGVPLDDGVDRLEELPGRVAHWGILTERIGDCPVPDGAEMHFDNGVGAGLNGQHRDGRGKHQIDIRRGDAGEDHHYNQRGNDDKRRGNTLTERFEPEPHRSILPCFVRARSRRNGQSSQNTPNTGAGSRPSADRAM